MIGHSFLKVLIDQVERGRVPDSLVRWGIRRLCQQRLRDEGADATERARSARVGFLSQLRAGPIAIQTEKANEQHYELPAGFFELVLGKHLKYSCGLWPAGVRDLDAAEEMSLKATCEHADLRDGMDVLELGCGWGALSLWMASVYPRSRITAVSNSHSQRGFIEARALERGLHNLRVITADMNTFAPEDRFERVVSVEMFEHMRNHEELLARISRWLRPGGRLFVHIFCHRSLTYPFQAEGSDDWMGRHFFTGGVMPSEDLLDEFPRHLTRRRGWRWEGTHYQRTAEAWLRNLDTNREQAMAVLARTYGSENAPLWFHRWRVFFMACAELFGFGGGKEWFVSHAQYHHKPTA